MKLDELVKDVIETLRAGHEEALKDVKYAGKFEYEEYCEAHLVSYIHGYGCYYCNRLKGGVDE